MFPISRRKLVSCIYIGLLPLAVALLFGFSRRHGICEEWKTDANIEHFDSLEYTLVISFLIQGGVIVVFGLAHLIACSKRSDSYDDDYFVQLDQVSLCIGCILYLYTSSVLSMFFFYCNEQL